MNKNIRIRNTRDFNLLMAELTGVSEEEHSQDSAIAPVNYSPEVEAAIHEVSSVCDHVRSGTCFAGISQHR